jgi:two-component system CheB/CheR fusion protein
LSHGKGDERTLQREVDRFLLRKLDPAAVLVDDEFNVVQFRGNTKPFIEHHPGKASLNLRRMTRDTLRLDLRSLLQRAEKQQALQKKDHLYFEDGAERSLTLEVSPLQFDQEKFFLIQFIPHPAGPQTAKAAEPRGEATESALGQENLRLKRELATSQE